MNILLLGHNGSLGFQFLEILSYYQDCLTYVIRKENEKANQLPKNIQINNEDDLFASDIKFDLVINSIGRFLKDSALDIDEKKVNQLINDNFLTLDHYFKKIKPLMQENGYFINIGSIASLTENSNEFTYGMSKKMVDLYLREQNSSCNFSVVNIKSGAIKTKTLSDRKDFENFIEAKDLLNLIMNITNSGDSIKISELVVLKKSSPHN